MTQIELAEKLGVDNTTISKWEALINEPDINKLKRLAEIFETSIDYLISGKEPIFLREEGQAVSIENEVLAADLQDAKIYESYTLYCMAQMNKALSLLDSPAFDHFSLECQRAMNDLKHLKFKKQLAERMINNAKL